MTLAACAAVLITSLAPAAPAGAQAPAPSCANESIVPTTIVTAVRARYAMLCLINRQRRARGLAALRTNLRLTAVAQVHANDLVRRRYFSHYTWRGPGIAFRTFRGRLIRFRYPVFGRTFLAGEALGWNFDEWAMPAISLPRIMLSPPHRFHILRSLYREIGIGVVARAPFGLLSQQGATYVINLGLIR